MTSPLRAADEVLQPSPGFALQFDFEGNPYFSSLTAPYHRATPLQEAHRLLHACFEGTGTSAGDAARDFLRLKSLKATPGNLRLVLKLVADLKEVGGLVLREDPASYYTREMARDYLEQRTIPPAVLDWVIAAGGVGKKTRVLDLGSGTGALSNTLARHSHSVTGMDVSAGFLRTAREDAERKRLKVRYLRESANRLAFHRERYDLVTISLAFHWLDPFLATEGIATVLERSGRFIVLEGAPRLPPAHPLRKLIPEQPKLDPGPLAEYYNALFRAAQRPGVRLPHLAVHSTFAFTERRTLGLAYARAFMAPEILKEAGVKEWKQPRAYWTKLEKKLEGLPERRFRGRFEWLGLELRYVSD